MSDTYTVTLPYPPTMNTYWRSIGRGRVLLSEKGRAYRDAAILAVRQKGTPATFVGRLSVTMLAHQKDMRRHDLDNLWKGVLDALAYAGVYVDDSQIDELRAMRRYSPDGPFAIVTVVESPAPAEPSKKRKATNAAGAARSE